MRKHLKIIAVVAEFATLITAIFIKDITPRAITAIGGLIVIFYSPI